MHKKIVTIYSILHFVVDLSCAVLISHAVAANNGGASELFMAMILYNFFAFAMQLPIGIIADSRNRNALFAAVGCLLVATSFGFSAQAMLSAIVAGIGNAMFHIGGGIDVLQVSRKQASLPGIFVSTGALGIFLGSMSALAGFWDYRIIRTILICSMFVLIRLYFHVKDTVHNEEMKGLHWNKNVVCAVACFMITVCLRSYVGLILAFEWKANILWACLMIGAVVFGKMLGGIIGDRVGFEKMLNVSLGLSAICFLFAFYCPPMGVLAVLCFNMTMPITLIALSNLLNRNKGMAFGLLTFALFIGALPTFFDMGTTVLFTPAGLCGLTVLSWIVLHIGMKTYRLCPEVEA